MSRVSAANAAHGASKAYQQVTAVVVTPAAVSQSSLTSGAWLRSLPRGAYTTGRTIRRNLVMLYPAHVERLATSFESMFEAPVTPAAIDHKLKHQLGTGLKYWQEMASDRDEVKFTTIVYPTSGSEAFKMSTHFQALPPRPVQPVKVVVAGKGRHNAEAKDSSWVRERTSLEDSKPDDVNEVLLLDDKGGILEGTQSNFFAIINGRVVTADEGVLAGTVRSLVLDACKAHGIGVDFRPPTMAELQAGAFEGALLSSTSRLALPISHIVVPARQSSATGAAGVIQFATSTSLASDIDKWVQESLVRAATQVLGDYEA